MEVAPTHTVMNALGEPYKDIVTRALTGPGVGGREPFIQQSDTPPLFSN